MKTYYILLVTLFIVAGVNGQLDQPYIPCLPEGIEFSTQAQIDNFHINYPNCTSIQGDVFISGSNISNLTGLNVLTSINGQLEIYGNPSLTSLAGLNALTTIWGDLTIDYNNSLTSLSGLDNINVGSIFNLSIFGNSSLSTCDVQSVCYYLASPTGSVNIYGNATGCNNPPEVATGCGISLSCLPYGNYYFISQSDVDNYQTNYPSCTHVEGNVYIKGGSQITNLNGLGILKSIGGSFFVINQVSLTSLEGLSALTTIGADLYIRNNSALTSLTGLDSLTTIGGYLLLQLNPTLTSLFGLKVLKSIGDELYIDENSVLLNLSGLDSLTSIGSSLGIYYEPALTSLTALNSLTSVGTSIDIIGNYSLTSLAGLDNINAGSISFLSIYENSVLSICNVQSVCDYLLNPNSEFNIYSNASGCNSGYEIEVACAAISVESLTPVPSFSIYPNPSDSKITLETTGKSQLTILNINGQELLQQEITKPITTIDISTLPSGVYVVRLTNDRTVEVGKILKQ